MTPIHSVLFVRTGGTFDKDYNPITGQLYFPLDTYIPNLLEQARFTGAHRIVSPFSPIDSQDMQDDHRGRIIQTCRENTELSVVIVNGTDRLVETARAIQTVHEEASLRDKTIAVTGAMIPARFAKSDALGNLIAAVICATTFCPGVYVVIHGKIFDPSHVRKDKELGIFEEI